MRREIDLIVLHCSATRPSVDVDADQQAWIDYRQALRDVPQQNGFPTDIDWPMNPE